MAEENAAFWNAKADEQQRLLDVSRAEFKLAQDEKEAARKAIRDAMAGGGSGSSGDGSTAPSSTVAPASGRSRSGSNTGDPSIGKNRVGGVQGNFGGHGSRFGRAPTMDEREAAAGLTLAGNNTMRGRASTGAGGKAGDEGAATGKADNLPQEQLSVLKSIELEIKKNP